MTVVAEAEPTGAALAEAVADEEYARLLDWPRHRPLEGVLAARAAGARAWYAAHGHPWVAARRIELTAIDSATVTLETGAALHGPALAGRLREGSSHAAVAVALTAGPELEAEARRLWAEDRPDESFFLDRFGAAVAEELLRWSSRWVCRAAEPNGDTVSFPLSPGCGGWPFSDQPTLLGLLAEGTNPSIGPITMLESGGLIPGHSILALLALTREPMAAAAADPCGGCDLSRCAFRRAPYRRPG